VAGTKANFGGAGIEVAIEPAIRPATPAARLLQVEDSNGAVQVMLELDAELSAQLDRSEQPRVNRAERKQESCIETLLQAGNLELLMDVELAVMLRFGSRHAPLREVLELAPGAVLELDREIHEPVDLLLNDRVIARGDVVVVDGNYALHITEVASPEQRARSL